MKLPTYPYMISKVEWCGLGGLANPLLFRRQIGGTWYYFKS